MLLTAMLALAAQVATPSAATTVTAPAQTPSPAAAPAAVKTAIAAPTASPRDKVVCKVEATNGQRITRKVCRSVAEWEALEIGAREYMRDRRELAPTR